jgi:hypothetical protein
MPRSASLEATDPPSIGRATVAPGALEPAEYEARIASLRDRLADRALSHAAIYADREHGANVEFLTGFDARFEEALLVVGADDTPALLVGNEGLHYAQVAAPATILYNVREFSLPGQPLKDARPLTVVLRELGLQRGARVGTAGWKSLGSGPAAPIDVPHYIVQALEEAIGAPVASITDAFTDAEGGLRAVNSAAQLAQFEFAATECSESLLEALLAVSEGVSEFDLVRAMRLPGLPLSVHPMVMSGERTQLGLASPSGRRLGRGEPLMMALGMRGALNARAGLIEEWESPNGSRNGAAHEYLEQLVLPYFAAIRAWWSTLRIGITGGELHAVVEGAIGPTFSIALNPGHLIHIEEWLDTPIRPGSTTPLRSGALLQCDIIPVHGNPAFAMNVEDTVALADEALRSEIRDAYPEMWERIQLRRNYVAASFGTDLAPEVLPFSNLAGYVAPYLLSPGVVLKAERTLSELA